MGATQRPEAQHIFIALMHLGREFNEAPLSSHMSQRFHEAPVCLSEKIKGLMRPHCARPQVLTFQ